MSPQNPIPENFNRIQCLVVFNFFLAAIACRIRNRVTLIPVGLYFQEVRAFTLANVFGCFLNGLMDFLGIHAINRLGGMSKA